MNPQLLDIQPRVAEALSKGKAVVALESTIIAHGMPYPANVQTALAVERIVEESGAVPATLGILEGRIVVGLSPAQIEFFSTSKEIVKATERDLPLALARRQCAATTAGASIAIAAAAGIPVFVTGGIGGVGPVAFRDFDISADLQALAGYPVITVCAGAKAFMDIPATLEYLETLRVPVVTYRTDEFPMFYSRHSGAKNGWVAVSSAEIAAAFRAARQLGQQTGMLVANPIPAAHALPEEETLRAVGEAMERIQKTGITGKAVTPFLLAAIQEATKGRSLQANIALIENNARLGAEIAVALTR